MNTPIFDFLERYAARGTVRGHMPGHKGRDVYGRGLERLFEYDITEVCGADELFSATGIISQSEENASRLFGTAATFFSAGGSTLCVQAMLAAVCGKSRAFICGRNAHKAVMNACVLLGLEPCWIFPKYGKDGFSAVSGEISPEAVGAAIEEYFPKKPACVFITSPDYLGKIADIEGIAAVCHEAGIPLIVDNAHGAYLAFTEPSRHPIHRGADMCCDSAHKTLPALTGGAYVHLSDGLCAHLAPVIKRHMALFGSSSPSYLILASLDLCNSYLAGKIRQDLAEISRKIQGLKEDFDGVYSFCGDEPLKLSIYAIPCGLTGYELAEQLREGGVEPEYADVSHVVMMFSAATTGADIERVRRALKSVRMPRVRLETPEFEVHRPEVKMLPREAFFAESEEVPAEKAAGRIAAEAVTVCPPCVPIVAAGEVIDEIAVKILKNYSIFKVNVLK
ncbi:MAG: aminotransferase class I/II-fold pyridoxal phosphate-dependent enzyme [Ruminococcus sp.]|nr:aminotransferase class I/II-fold pyridoxal phosphate-dependent enzyme [Ruminococcus sp.]MCM1480471.1 aminotransferase class I/II-fold pyridoxal phosphate-dependent enzyme [Muribaculaceae bacterium]